MAHIQELREIYETLRGPCDAVKKAPEDPERRLLLAGIALGIQIRLHRYLEEHGELPEPEKP